MYADQSSTFPPRGLGLSKCLVSITYEAFTYVLIFFDLQKAAAVQKWCYTLNNPTSEPLVDEDLVEYHVYGEEVGESGTPHYQGFIIFKTRVSLNTLQHLIPRAHYEIAKGKNSQAANYCKKMVILKRLVLYLQILVSKAVKRSKSATRRLLSWRSVEILTRLIVTCLSNTTELLNRLGLTMLRSFLPLIKLLEFGFTATRELVNRAMPGRHIRVPTSRTVTSGGMVTKKKKMLLSMILTILIISWAITLKDGQTIMPLLQKLKEVLCISGLRKLSLLANFG